MGSRHNIAYKDIIQQFRDACEANLGIYTFDTGTLDFLDANAVNKNYPYIYLRPLSSQGVVDRVRGITFELYSMDVPKLSDESPVDVLSDCEERIYQLLAWFNKGETNIQQVYEVTITDLSPVNEAFQDRVYGWVATIDVLTPWRWDYCDYPQVVAPTPVPVPTPTPTPSPTPPPTPTPVVTSSLALRITNYNANVSTETCFNGTNIEASSSVAYAIVTASLDFPDNVIGAKLYFDSGATMPYSQSVDNFSSDTYTISLKSGSEVGNRTHTATFDVPCYNEYAFQKILVQFPYNTWLTSSAEGCGIAQPLDPETDITLYAKLEDQFKYKPFPQNLQLAVLYTDEALTDLFYVGDHSGKYPYFAAFDDPTVTYSGEMDTSLGDDKVFIGSCGLGIEGTYVLDCDTSICVDGTVPDTKLPTTCSITQWTISGSVEECPPIVVTSSYEFRMSVYDGTNTSPYWNGTITGSTSELVYAKVTASAEFSQSLDGAPLYFDAELTQPYSQSAEFIASGSSYSFVTGSEVGKRTHTIKIDQPSGDFILQAFDAQEINPSQTQTIDRRCEYDTSNIDLTSYAYYVRSGSSEPFANLVGAQLYNPDGTPYTSGFTPQPQKTLYIDVLNSDHTKAAWRYYYTIRQEFDGNNWFVEDVYTCDREVYQPAYGQFIAINTGSVRVAPNLDEIYTNLVYYENPLDGCSDTGSYEFTSSLFITPKKDKLYPCTIEDSFLYSDEAGDIYFSGSMSGSVIPSQSQWIGIATSPTASQADYFLHMYHRDTEPSGSVYIQEIWGCEAGQRICLQ